MIIRIDLFTDGFLTGFTFYPAENADDYNEFNLYILLARITIQW